jgi:hypothetical protein
MNNGRSLARSRIVIFSSLRGVRAEFFLLGADRRPLIKLLCAMIFL